MAWHAKETICCISFSPIPCALGRVQWGCASVHSTVSACTCWLLFLYDATVFLCTNSRFPSLNHWSHSLLLFTCPAIPMPLITHPHLLPLSLPRASTSILRINPLLTSPPHKILQKFEYTLYGNVVGLTSPRSHII